MKNTKTTQKQYEIKRNNYLGLLFFALVIVSALYIIKNQTQSFQIPNPTYKELIENKTEIIEETKEIKDLRNYLNSGDINTFKIYQSSYIYNETINSKEINDETMLYYAYKYIEKTSNMTNNIRIITCKEAELVNLNSNIYQCGGNKKPISYYTVNNYITKDLLKKTVQKIFNRNITKYTNFYTSEDNLCYYINNEYLCISHQTTQSNSNPQKLFVKAYKYTNKLTIIEKYKFIEDGIHYKGFNSNEVGEEYYISTFNKINGKYYWDNTKPYKNTN